MKAEWMVPALKTRELGSTQTNTCKALYSLKTVRPSGLTCSFPGDYQGRAKD